MLVDFIDLKKEDILIAGGKGANLGEMTAANINVPRGFVLTADSYRDYLRDNKIEPIIKKSIEDAANDENKLLEATASFRQLIKNGEFSEEVRKEIENKYSMLGENVRVAVRSSATAEDLPDASFAGQQETYLNVRGIDDLLVQIRNCYASLWGKRAVSYRLHQGYDQLAVSIAVVIQEMVESQKAGVLFTVNPVSKKDTEMQINASYGLGESVVSGRVTPDTYIVDKSGKILDISIGSKARQIVYGEKDTIEVQVEEDKRNVRALSDDEIVDLVKTGLSIQDHYGRPMDIEWAIRDNEIYILQARAITTLKNNEIDEDKVKAYLKDMKLSKGIRENLGFLLEKMPFAYRPLDYDFMIAINYQKSKIFAEGGLVINANPQMDQDGIQTLPDGSKSINKNIFKVLKIIKKIKDFDYCSSKCEEFMTQYRDELDGIKNIDFNKMNLEESKNFLKYSYLLTKKLAYDRFKYAMFPTMIVFDKYSKIIKKVNPSYTAFDFYWGLDNKTALVNNEISLIGQKVLDDSKLKESILSGASFEDLCARFGNFKEMTDEFLKKNGFKSDYNCYCLEAKTFIEEPDRIVNIIKPMLNLDSKDDLNSGEKDFDDLMEKLKDIYGNKYKRLEKDIKHFRYFHIVREESQYLWESLFYYVRKCVSRINMILLDSEDYKTGVANLFLKDLVKAMDRGYLSEEDKANIRRRQEKFPLATRVWEASKLLVFDAKGDLLKGVSGSAGSVVGRVCIIRNTDEFYKMQKGDILVCHLTDPEWTPLFKLASGVVADTGAALSHAAIVAREFNIPAVLGVGFATSRFKDGDMIQVDGDKGIVRGL
ncbi:PEP/pyruvate-binding domain-containing protein [Peptostreptococcus stomatis]